MADKVSEQIVLPQVPLVPDVPGLANFDRDQNRQLVDYLENVARKANTADLTDGGVIVGDIDLTGDLGIVGNLSVTGTFELGAIPDVEAAIDALEAFDASLGTAAFEDVGTSGHNLPFLDGNNTWSSIQNVNPEAWVTRDSDTPATIPIVKFQKGRAGPATVQTNDGIGGFLWAPYDGDSYGSPNAGALLAYALENHSNTNHGVAFAFETAPIGGTSRAERMRIAQGVFHASATGGDQGNNTINFSTIYRNGNLVPGPASQAEGDILYRNATDWARLAKGTSGQLLAQNSGLTAPEWVSPDFEFVGSVSGSSSSQLLLDSSTVGALAGSYDYMVVFDELQPSADGYLTLQYGTGGTPTYQNTNYQSHTFSVSAENRNTITTAMHLMNTGSVGGVTAGETISGFIDIKQLGTSQLHGAQGIIKNTDNSGNIRTNVFSGFRSTAEIVTGLRFAMNTGNINSGTIRLYRRRTT